jgi:small subunit ribosomal protein S14
MPKKSTRRKNDQRLKKSTNTTRQKIRLDLKSKLKTEDGVDAMFALQKRPKDESLTRHVRRCQVCARPKGVYRKFQLCRLCLIKYAGLGMIAGLTISSW